MAAVTSLARHAASLATSASSREPRRSKVHRAMEWPKPSSARSSVTMSASVRVRMQTPSCSSYQFGSLTTTRFTRTRHSDIVHPVSSSQLTEARDRVRSFGGYNKLTNFGSIKFYCLEPCERSYQVCLADAEDDWAYPCFLFDHSGDRSCLEHYPRTG